MIKKFTRQSECAHGGSKKISLSKRQKNSFSNQLCSAINWKALFLSSYL